MDQRIRKLDWAERWLVDIWAHMNRADFALSCDINMTPATIFLEDLRKTTITKLTYTHLFIWSLGKVISNHQELNVISRDYRHIYPSGVNINFPVASHAIFTPLMFVKDVEKNR